MISDENYLRRLRRAIGCPVDWTQYRHDMLFYRILLYYWSEVARKHQACGEMENYPQVMAILGKDERELEAIEHNSGIWRPRAVEEYKSKTHFISVYRHFRRDEHEKHWLACPVSDSSLVDMTKRGPAKYKYEFQLFELKHALRSAVRSNWRRIAEDSPLHLYVLFEDAVGMSNGTLAPGVRFDLDYTTGGVHSHPISIDEKPAKTRWLHELDDWWDMGSGIDVSMPTIDEDMEYSTEKPEKGGMTRRPR